MRKKGAENWWESAKASSLERRAAKSRRSSLANAGDSFLIVTEGTVTEPCYFAQLLVTLQLSPVRIQVVPGRKSDPKKVISTAATLANQQKVKKRRSITEPESFDQVWAVIDTDVAQNQGIWPEVLTLAQEKGVKIAQSTPCIEFWILLHLTYSTSVLKDGTAAKRTLQQQLGKAYSTNKKVAKEAISLLVGAWPTAVERTIKVRKFHLDAGNNSPANPSTDVDLLAAALNDSAPEHMRRLHK